MSGTIRVNTGAIVGRVGAVRGAVGATSSGNGNFRITISKNRLRNLRDKERNIQRAKQAQIRMDGNLISSLNNLITGVQLIDQVDSQLGSRISSSGRRSF